jgi:beta-xylosidase
LTGEEIACAEIKYKGGGSSDITVAASGISGVHDIYFIFAGEGYEMTSWCFAKAGAANNPIIYSDFPDPDVIRVGDTYYMISTTMHFMPGAEILRSYDLIHWEIASYVYETLEDTPAQKLDGDNIYGKGMWAASLRYHDGLFYVCFVANDTGKTYLYAAENIGGPWAKSNIEGFFHDSSLLFDDDGRVYIVHGNTQIKLTELESDLSAPKRGGVDRVIIKETDSVILGYEGAHIYKINGRYYVFLIH